MAEADWIALALVGLTISPLLTVPNVTAHPTAVYQLHIIRCGTIIASKF